MIAQLIALLKSRCTPKRGQTITEYVIVAGMLMASLAILMFFLATFREYGGRVLDLTASEYP